MIERQGEIVKYFEVVEMREPNEEQTINILLNKMQNYERNRIIFTYDGLKSIMRESNKFNWDFPMPERAIDLAMDVLMYWQKKGVEEYITEKTVLDFVSLKTGVPQGDIGGEEKKKLLNLEKTLHNFVIGQEEAIKDVAQALRRTRSGIGNSQKPIGSFLFLGPTGVGKTESAKALAKAYFGDEKKMIRFDMSEFQNSSSIDRMIGSSQLNQKGRLTTEVKDNPYSLILLDEIEKAYPEVLDIFLQILDEGFVTDAFGEKINFRNSIIIATSNAGAPLIRNMVEAEKNPEDIKQAVIDFTVQNNIFRLEFLNRFTGIVFFRPLNELELKSVVRLMLQKFAKRVQKEKNMEVEFDESVVDNMIEKGYNPIFGARSLDHYIEHTVEDLIATKIIEGDFVKGEKIMISF
jgi:ATP-dependent Clp protease ATP-binding subunit ClpA